MRRLAVGLLGSGAALTLGYAGLVAAVGAASGPDWMVPLPSWSDWLGVAALATALLGLVALAAAARGWRRWATVAAVPPVALFGFLALVLAEFGGQMRVLGRAALPDGRAVALTLEPVPTDSVYALWVAEGRGWRPLLRPVEQISYSEDGSFVADPALVPTPDGGRLLIRRGGLWTDCVEVSGPARPCRETDATHPVTREDFLARSAAIAALVGMPPTRP